MDSGDPWNPKPEVVKKAMAMLRGVHRVLKSDGIFISIAFGQVRDINIIRYNNMFHDYKALEN